MADAHSLTGVAPSTASPVLGEMVRRLVELYRPEKVYLFGSVARRDATADSDYDNMIVAPDTSVPTLKQNRERIQQAASPEGLPSFHCCAGRPSALWPMMRFGLTTRRRG